MSNLKPINHQNIIDAIQRIDNNPQLKKQRGSSTYDLVYNGRSYPPILVLSEANKVCGGEELLLSDFGNNTDKAFKLLRDLGFIVIMKRKLAFKEYLQTSTPDGSGTTTSYLQSIDNLDELFNESGRISGSIYNIEDINFWERLIDDIKLYQKDSTSILYKKPKSYAEKNFYSASIRKYINFLIENKLTNSLQKVKGEFSIKAFNKSLNTAHLHFSELLITRFVTSLITKPFVILTGLAGSGKTKLAQSFIQWICESEEQYKIVAVGADWINREPLLGYPNGLIETEYVTPDNGVLQLMLDAAKEDNQEKPYFLVLDEMNLSHVERYFADFLSIMESNDSIKLYTGTERKSTDGEDIPKAISWPKNLFIIGTVNIDETTYMFSPKVLDRANVIEFRLDEEDLTRFLLQPLKVDLIQLVSQGSFMASSFLTLSQEKETTSDSELNSTLVEFFKELKVIGAEFGYRSAFEIHLLFAQFSTIDPVLTIEDKIDLAVMQKLLPKLHGSRSKIVKTLEALLKLCLVDNTDFNISKIEAVTKENIKYHVSFDKLKRMYYNALNNGFTSYAEA